MDKKQVYCRYCGKLIDEDALFALIAEKSKMQIQQKQRASYQTCQTK